MSLVHVYVRIAKQAHFVREILTKAKSNDDYACTVRVLLYTTSRYNCCWLLCVESTLDVRHSVDIDSMEKFLSERTRDRKIKLQLLKH